jgi:hypothetical protein
MTVGSDSSGFPSAFIHFAGQYFANVPVGFLRSTEVSMQRIGLYLYTPFGAYFVEVCLDWMGSLKTRFHALARV